MRAQFPGLHALPKDRLSALVRATIIKSVSNEPIVVTSPVVTTTTQPQLHDSTNPRAEICLMILAVMVLVFVIHLPELRDEIIQTTSVPHNPHATGRKPSASPSDGPGQLVRTGRGFVRLVSSLTSSLYDFGAEAVTPFDRHDRPTSASHHIHSDQDCSLMRLSSAVVLERLQTSCRNNLSSFFAADLIGLRIVKAARKRVRTSVSADLLTKPMAVGEPT